MDKKLKLKQALFNMLLKEKERIMAEVTKSFILVIDEIDKVVDMLELDDDE